MASNSFASDSCTKRMHGILDYPQTIFLRQLMSTIDIAGYTREVKRYNGSGSFCD